MRSEGGANELPFGFSRLPKHQLVPGDCPRVASPVAELLIISQACAIVCVARREMSMIKVFGRHGSCGDEFGAVPDPQKALSCEQNILLNSGTQIAASRWVRWATVVLPMVLTRQWPKPGRLGMIAALDY